MKESYPERRLKSKLRIRLAAFIVALLVTGYSLFYTVVHASQFRIPNAIVAGISLVFLLIFGAFMWVVNRQIYKWDDRLEKDISSSQRGADGEAQAREVISQVVGTSHEIFFSKELPRGGDIDCLVLGKKGLILIEVKNRSGKTYQTTKWGPYDARKEAILHSIFLKKYLKENGYEKPLYIRVAVLHINELAFWGKQGVTNIRGTKSFSPFFNRLPDSTEMNEEDIRQLSALINALR